MNSKAAIFFLILLIINISFAFYLIIIEKIQRKRELSYIYAILIIKSLLSLGPALLMFGLNIEWSAYITGPLKALLIPLSYLYLYKLSTTEKGLNNKDLWHFIPAAITLALTLIIVPGNESEIVGKADEAITSTIRMTWRGGVHHNILATTSRIICFLQSILYSYLVYKISNKYHSILENHYSSISYSQVKWFKWLIILTLFQGFFEGFGLLGIYNLRSTLILAFIFHVIYAFFIAVHVSIQKQLDHLVNTSIETTGSNSENKENSFLILEKFRKEELFLHPDITLEDVAASLQIPKYKLSNIIKYSGYNNFYDFINKHRIEKSIHLLSKMPQNHVIDSIIEQSGFKSRATFYRVFKQTTGKTPSELIQQR